MALVLACLVGALMGAGTYLLLQRSPIRMVLGLGLFTHGVNLLLFGTGASRRGHPPVLEKAFFEGDTSQLELNQYLEQFVDPLPQALILTAIVISFGIIAFFIALINRRHSLETTRDSSAERTDDPFALQPRSQLRPVEEDYEWLEDVVFRQQTEGNN
ncbi:MAG: cation:proton antiporter [Chloroflexi bacterium]|nr:MAG: cation:proton antiporter [Chloroflexota bacterium]